jgi:hypothetical protein
MQNLLMQIDINMKNVIFIGQLWANLQHFFPSSMLCAIADHAA